jgi:hypothetical protein
MIAPKYAGYPKGAQYGYIEFVYHWGMPQRHVHP